MTPAALLAFIQNDEIMGPRLARDPRLPKFVEQFLAYLNPPPEGESEQDQGAETEPPAKVN
jgi:hypothetical protein